MIEHQRFLHQRVNDRCRIGEARRFDHHALETSYFTCFPPLVQIDQGCHQVAADGAADTAAGQIDDTLIARFDQQMIEPDLAEFVDDHGRILKRRIAQNTGQNGRFSAAEETCQHGNGYKRLAVHGLQSVLFGPGCHAGFVDGELVVKGRSEQTPPPQERASVEFAYGCPFCGLGCEDLDQARGCILRRCCINRICRGRDHAEIADHADQ